MTSEPHKTDALYYQVIDPATGTHRLPAITTLLNKICNGDVSKFDDAIALVDLFMQAAYDMGVADALKSFHTNEISNPEWEPDGDQAFDHNRIYINKTHDLWYRVNYTKNTTELWFNGQWQAEWPTTEIETIIQPMLRYALQIGKRERSKEIKKLIG